MDVELILRELQPFELSHLEKFLHCRVYSLCNQLLHSFLCSQTLQTYCGHIEDVPVDF